MFNMVGLCKGVRERPLEGTMCNGHIGNGRCGLLIVWGASDWIFLGLSFCESWVLGPGLDGMRGYDLMEGNEGG